MEVSDTIRVPLFVTEELKALFLSSLTVELSHKICFKWQLGNERPENWSFSLRNSFNLFIEELLDNQVKYLTK